MIFHLKIDCKIDIYKPLQQNNFFENLPLRYLSPRQYSPTMQLLHVNVLDWYKVVDKTRTRTADDEFFIDLLVRRGLFKISLRKILSKIGMSATHVAFGHDYPL